MAYKKFAHLGERCDLHTAKFMYGMLLTEYEACLAEREQLRSTCEQLRQEVALKDARIRQLGIEAHQDRQGFWRLLQFCAKNDVRLIDATVVKKEMSDNSERR